MSYLQFFASLPSINRIVGVFDPYGRGKVRHIDFDGECINGTQSRPHRVGYLLKIF